MTQIYAPWTDDQVTALNNYQQSGRMHPFTGERYPDGRERILIATNQGWVAEEGGPVVQIWAWDFMAKKPEPNEDVVAVIFPTKQFHNLCNMFQLMSVAGLRFYGTGSALPSNEDIRDIWNTLVATMFARRIK